MKANFYKHGSKEPKKKKVPGKWMSLRAYLWIEANCKKAVFFLDPDGFICEFRFVLDGQNMGVQLHAHPSNYVEMFDMLVDELMFNQLCVAAYNEGRFVPSPNYYH